MVLPNGSSPEPPTLWPRPSNLDFQLPNHTINALQLLVRVMDAATEFAYDDTSAFDLTSDIKAWRVIMLQLRMPTTMFLEVLVLRDLSTTAWWAVILHFHSTVHDPQYVVPGPTLSGQNEFSASGFGGIGGNNSFKSLSNNSLRAVALAPKAEQGRNSLQASSPTPQPSSSGARGVSHCPTSFCTFKT